MEEVNLKDLFSYFINKIGLIIITTLVVVLLGCLYALYIQKPMYQSSTTIVLVGDNENVTGNMGITSNDIALNQKLVATYREIMKSRLVLNQVINNLDLDSSYNELKNQISVTNEKDTELIRISVDNLDSRKAKEIANEIARVFSNEIVEIYSIKNVSVIDYAEEMEKPYNVNVLKQTVLSGLIGAILSCGIVFIMFYFDTTIKNTSEIEEKLGLPVLGTVPMNGRKGGKK